MRKIFFKLRTGYCGMDGHDMLEFPDDVTNEQLDDEAWNIACEYAASYGIYPESEDDGDEDEESQYSGHNIEGRWEEYNPEKHDGYL
jgi:hypothetical protein